MMTWLIVLVAVAAVVALVALAYTQGRTAALRRRFGPEYDRAVERHGGRRGAEADLREVARRRADLDIRELPAPVRRRYQVRWRDVQMRFVDEPATAVRLADGLVADVMRERGYPTDDDEERAAMLAADHPELVAEYRAARDVDGGGGPSAAAGTETLREAFVHFRAVFDELLRDPVDEPVVVVDDERAADVDRRVAARRKGAEAGS